MSQECEGCGTRGDGYTKIYVTNGALTLCRQCLDDVNRKNPQIPVLEARIRELEAERDAAIARLEALLKALGDRKFGQFLLGLAIKLGVPIDSEDEKSLLMDRIAPAVDCLVKRAEALDCRFIGMASKHTHRGVEIEELKDTLRDSNAKIAAMRAALETVKIRIHFIGMPQEPIYQGRPNWENAILAIEAALASNAGKGWHSPEEWKQAQAQLAAMRSWMTKTYRHDEHCAARGPTTIGEAFPPCNCGLDAAFASDAGKPLLDWIERAAKALEPFALWSEKTHPGDYIETFACKLSKAAEVRKDKP